MKKKVFYVVAIVTALIALWLSITPIVEALTCEEQFEACIAGCGVRPTDKCFRGCMVQYDGC